jgi:asparagine synthase (glutamine-hydrolysing)
MSHHAGAFYFDMRPMAGEASTLAASLGSIAGDRVSVYAAPGLAMSTTGCSVWSHASTATGILQTKAGLAIAWDGRVDNRRDLLVQLSDAVDGHAADDAIAVAAFERWGIDGLKRLVGEWSLAIWDGRHRALLLARDYIGARPLYYSSNDRSVFWSTVLGEIVDRSGRSCALDDAFIAAFLTFRHSNRRTPYSGVHAVPAAGSITFDAGASRAGTRRPYWTPEANVVRFKDQRQYEERLRELWADAVGTRLRSKGSVWSELSGGLDSSSVVCMADALIKGGGVDASCLRTVSHVTLESPEGDERRFIAEVEAQTGITSEIVGVEANQDLVDGNLAWVTPFCSRGVGLATVRRVLEADGSVILSGRLGDNVMGCEPDNSVAVWDDIADGQWLRALANLRRWSRSTRKPVWQIARHVADAGLFPGRIGASRDGTDGSELLTPALQRLASNDMPAGVPAVRVSKRELAASIVEYGIDARLDIPAQPPRITYAYPFSHRPLVEFMLAIPSDQVSAPGETRSLMRRAFADLVPPRILRRFSKGYYPPSAARAARLRATSLRPVERLEIVQRGWVSAAPLERAIDLLVDGGAAPAGIFNRLLRLEDWLRLRQRRAPAAIPRRKEVTRHGIFNA